MPFYDYVCQACGRRIEVMHGVHATGPDRCDACGGEMRRAISRPAIHFKGSGWAKMDARASAARPAADASRETPPGGTASEVSTAPSGDGGSAPPAPEGAADASSSSRAEPVVGGGDGTAGTGARAGEGKAATRSSSRARA